MCLGPRTQELTLLLRNGRKSVSESRDWQFRALSNKLELCKSRTAAAAETCWTCWWSLGCSALLLSTWRIMSHLSKIKSNHERKWPGTHLFLLACLAILHRQSTFHCHGTPVLQGYVRQYVHVCECLQICKFTLCFDLTTSFHLAVSCCLACRRMGRGVGAATTSIYLGSCSGPTHVLQLMETT